MTLPISRDRVFPFFADAANLARITPPDLRFEIVSPRPVTMHAGALIEYRIRVAGLRLGWLTRISRWDPPHAFVDEQLRGPYRSWIHTHRFLVAGDGTRVVDDVEYVLPLSPLGDVAHPWVARRLRRIFAYRERAVRAAFGAAGREPEPRD